MDTFVKRPGARQGLGLLAILGGVAMLANAAPGRADAKKPHKQWPQGKEYTLKGLRVSVSAPVLVARRKGYCWFASVGRLANGDLAATMSSTGDDYHWPNPGLICWSADAGLTWSRPVGLNYLGTTRLRLPGGDEMLLPFYMKPRPGGMGAPYNVIPKGKRQVRPVEQGLTVTGWPRPDRSYSPKLGLSGFVFNGQIVRLKDGGHLATLYGRFAGGDRQADSLVAAASTDGKKWTVRSIIYDGARPAFGGIDEMNEAAICRLPDGRIMCVARPRLAQTFSSDEGKTWTKPACNPHFGHGGVEPSLAVMESGVVALSGGRPGLTLRFNLDGAGKAWQAVDILAHHNACRPAEPLVDHAVSRKNYGWGTPTGYTEVIALDAERLLMIYDRPADTWPAKPTAEKATDMDSVYVVRATVAKGDG